MIGVTSRRSGLDDTHYRVITQHRYMAAALWLRDDCVTVTAGSRSSVTLGQISGSAEWYTESNDGLSAPPGTSSDSAPHARRSRRTQLVTNDHPCSQP